MQAQLRGDSALPEQLYQAAITALVALQRGVDATQLPAYDRARLHNEMKRIIAEPDIQDRMKGFGKDAVIPGDK